MGARRLRTFEDAERGLCFGRLTLEGAPRPLYVGRRWVHDEERGLVVNWQAPAARPFYTATPADPQRSTVRRRYRTEGRRLLDISDELLDGTGDRRRARRLPARGARAQPRRAHARHRRDDPGRPVPADHARPEGVLVIQGGPGTGKTAVGLHRASYLLYTHRARARPRGVLVVGPNRDLHGVRLARPAGARRGGASSSGPSGSSSTASTLDARDPPAVARLKGDPRLAEVIARAAELRQAPAPEELDARLEGAFVHVRAREVGELLEEVHGEHGARRRRASGSG